MEPCLCCWLLFNSYQNEPSITDSTGRAPVRLLCLLPSNHPVFENLLLGPYWSVWNPTSATPYRSYRQKKHVVSRAWPGICKPTSPRQGVIKMPECGLRSCKQASMDSTKTWKPAGVIRLWDKCSSLGTFSAGIDLIQSAIARLRLQPNASHGEQYMHQARRVHSFHMIWWKRGSQGSMLSHQGYSQRPSTGPHGHISPAKSWTSSPYRHWVRTSPHG